MFTDGENWFGDWIGVFFGWRGFGEGWGWLDEYVLEVGDDVLETYGFLGGCAFWVGFCLILSHGVDFGTK